MKKRSKEPTRRNDGARQQPEPLASRQPRVEVASGSLAERETRVSVNERAVLSREEGALVREEDASRREEGASRREEGASRREEGATQREQRVEVRESVATLREEGVAFREEASADSNPSAQALLREANEHLVIATVRAQTMTEAAEQATAQMAHMAEHDFLTGLPNRALLGDRLERAIALAQRHGKKAALMYLDLDNFKNINDSIGHSVGDELLRIVAKRLKACVRLSDTVSRQGGDEFVVLLSELDDAGGAKVIADKLIRSLAQPYLIGEHRLHATASIGISIYPDDGEDMEAVMSHADIAMYSAKRSGRNAYRFFTADMKTVSVARQSIEQALHVALEKDQFVLHYQPIVNLNTGAITGAEALLRLRTAGSRLTHPSKFMGIAEDCGLIVPIGKWARREACRQTRLWLLAGLDPGRIAVNVSATELRGKDFVTGVRAILDDTGLDPNRLVIELTETGPMQDSQQMTSILNDLKDLGVQIAIDDFGTGYSSLSYLRSFPIDELKIDQSFVRGANGDAGNAIVQAVIAIGTSMNLRVVAEGIDTGRKLDFLRTHLCAEGQGFLLGRPLNAPRFAALMANQLVQ